MPPQPSSSPISPLAAILAGRATAGAGAGASASPAPAPAPASTSTISRPANQGSGTNLAQRPGPQPTLLRPERADITHGGGETAQELDQQLQQSTKEFRNALVRIAHTCHRLYVADAWPELGFADAESYFAARGFSTTWKAHVLLGQRLSHLKIEEMQQISLEAARLLTGISAKLWEEFSWVDEARMLSVKEFSLLVKQRGAGQKSLGEPKAALSLKVPLTQLDQLERRFDLIRRQHHLATPAATLDFMLRVAELGPGVVTTAERLDRSVLELQRVLEAEAPDDNPEAARLIASLKRHLKDLRRYANGLPSEVTEIESSPAGGHPAA